MHIAYTVSVHLPCIRYLPTLQSRFLLIVYQFDEYTSNVKPFLNLEGSGMQAGSE